MKFETVVDSLNFAWDQVVVAFWARYPNPYTTHVLTEDVLRREVEYKDLEFHTITRKITCEDIKNKFVTINDASRLK